MTNAASLRSEQPQAIAGQSLGVGRLDGSAEGIDRLIAAMTLEEKAGQLTIMPAAKAPALAEAANPAAMAAGMADQEQAVRDGLLGGVFNGDDADWHRRMQHVAVHESRLGIPLLFAADVIHGFRTIFPVPLAEAAAFDPDLARRTARAAAEEATATGLSWNFAPMVDVSRDARWGRGVEGAGEDVLLGCALATARVEGFQGEGLSDPTAMLATPKHLAAYGAAAAGLDYAGADVSERTLREIYFPPFQAAFDAGALSTMAAFNDVAGVPCHANPWLMKDVLRGDWGFEGFVVSDYTGDFELIAHGSAEDERDAARLAFQGGVDMSMSSGLYARWLPDLVRSGEVAEADVDAAVRRVLRLKAALGLFDDPFNRLHPGRTEVDHAPRHRDLAREAARRSLVLLKNEGGLLPLSRDLRIALIGPFATGHDHLNGPWVLFGDPGQAVSVEDGVRAALSNPQALTVARGCGAEREIPGGVEEAVAGGGGGERGGRVVQSRLDIGLPEPQRALVEAVRAVGKPTVLILKCGRALTLDPASDASEAIMVAWFLGVETGTALADVLFGDHAPSGRLPVSFPRHVGQSPFHYDRKATGRPPLTLKHGEEFKSRWRESLNVAAWPFGHGLTYGDIAYSDLDAGDGRMAWDGSLEIAATVTNRGSREADEVVQLYVHDRAASVTRPIRQLKGFRRVTLAPGASQRVAFTLTRADLTFVGPDLTWIAEPGRFTVWIAPSAETGVEGQFELLAG
jgi:beta-glucosidase